MERAPASGSTGSKRHRAPSGSYPRRCGGWEPRLAADEAGARARREPRQVSDSPGKAGDGLTGRPGTRGRAGRRIPVLKSELLCTEERRSEADNGSRCKREAGDRVALSLSSSYLESLKGDGPTGSVASLALLGEEHQPVVRGEVVEVLGVQRDQRDPVSGAT